MMKVASTLPRKTIVLETGFVSKGTIVPLSNSLEMLFIETMSAKRKTPMPGRAKVTAKLGSASMGCPVATLEPTGKAQINVARINATITKPKNFFFRMFQSISYLTTAQKRVNQLGGDLPIFVLVVTFFFSLVFVDELYENVFKI
jgi:hypothetical protein